MTLFIEFTVITRQQKTGLDPVTEYIESRLINIDMLSQIKPALEGPAHTVLQFKNGQYALVKTSYADVRRLLRENDCLGYVPVGAG